MRGSDSRLSFSEKDRGKVWKDHMERFINEENEWKQSWWKGQLRGLVGKKWCRRWEK